MSITRRDFLRGAAGVALLTGPGAGVGVGSALAREWAWGSNSPQGRPRTSLRSYVDPLIGTGGHGHTYPGATLPFGMVQLSPDTYNADWDVCSGYHQGYASIMGFSHTHLSGTGIGDLMDVLLMPSAGDVHLVPGPPDASTAGYRSRFDRADESATPGFYGVLLKDHGIRAELTATARCGLHRYTFPSGKPDDYRGLRDYRRLGLVPCDKEWEATSKTLEYAYDDWAVAHLAKGAGAQDDYRLLLERSRSYRNVFDSNLAFVRPRLADGSWASPFDPRALGHGAAWHDFTESNAWQATFLNQHDLYGYMALFDGEEGFAEKLDALFAASSEQLPGAPPDIAGLVGQYAHGNEPSHHVAYLYAYAGQHHKTQARVRSLLATMYSDKPDGLIGNEDCGQMSAWYVLSALGFYAVDPVSANYVIGSPLFDRAELDVGQGRKLVIEAKGNGPENIHIQSVTWNGKPYTRTWLRHTDLTAGGHLVFRMGARPNLRYGADRADRPPSFVPGIGRETA